MKKLFTLMVMALVAMSVSAKEELLISSYNPWSSSVTVEGSTITLGAGYQGGAIYVGADWTAYDYVWIKYKSASGNASFGITYDEWMKKESWGNVFASTTGTITDGDGIVGIKIDKESVMTHGNAETDGVGIGDVYAKHVQQITIQSGSPAASVTVEGIYYGTTAEFAADGGDVPVRPAYGKELVMWSGSHEYGSGWSETDVIEAKYFDVAKVGDLIRGYVTATDPNPVFKHVSDWSDFEDIQNTKTIADDKSYFEGTIATEAALAELKKSGLRLQGINFTLTKVVLINNDESEAPAAGGKSWDFTKTSADVIAALDADANWVASTEGTGDNAFTRYQYKNEIAKETYVDLASIGFAPGAGIEVGRVGGKMEGGKTIRIDANNRIQLNCSNGVFKIKDLKAGDVVKIQFACASSSEDRTFTVTNADKATVTATKDQAKIVETLTIAADGDLVLQQSKAINIYAIAVNGELPTGIQNIKAATKTIENNVIYNLAGQRVNESYKGIVIKNGKKFIQK